MLHSQTTHISSHACGLLMTNALELSHIPERDGAMRKLGILAVACTCAVMSIEARGDWADPGAVYLCDRRSNIFLMKSVMDTSSPEDPGTVPAPVGYSHLESTDNFRCRLKGVDIRGKFRIGGGGERGMCSGVTRTYIDSLTVNGIAVFEFSVSFNSQCIKDDELYLIEITPIDSKAKVRLCFADWNWGTGYAETRCDVKQL